MEYVAENTRDPFDLQPPCDQYVPGFGATSADFHIIGDHPGVHGGLSTRIPFTDTEWSQRFFDALVAGGILAGVDLDAGEIESPNAFFSYLHLCEPETEPPGKESYDTLEPYFDAELRAITAHVLLPVGERATRHVFEAYTAIDADEASEIGRLHATDHRGSGWLILPIKGPAEWTDEDARELVSALRSLCESDYQQISDLGRFLPDDDPYFVR